MSKHWERFFFLLTWILQGPSFLNPMAYAQMHLEHHKHSDTKEDPHSPHNYLHGRGFFNEIIGGAKMMWDTKKLFTEIIAGRHAIAHMYAERRFPQWKEVEIFAQSAVSRVFFAIGIICAYVLFLSSWWQLLYMWVFMVITILNGPIQGAIVNWFGHTHGSVHYPLLDNSRNTPGAGFMLGELYQNNHHAQPENPNFARKWYEFDLTYSILRLLHAIKIIQLKNQG